MRYACCYSPQQLTKALFAKQFPITIGYRGCCLHAGFETWKRLARLIISPGIFQKFPVEFRDNGNVSKVQVLCPQNQRGHIINHSALIVLDVGYQTFGFDTMNRRVVFENRQSSATSTVSSCAPAMNTASHSFIQASRETLMSRSSL